jgi:hypothetical protein
MHVPGALEPHGVRSLLARHGKAMDDTFTPVRQERQQCRDMVLVADGMGPAYTGSCARSHMESGARMGRNAGPDRDGAGAERKQMLQRHQHRLSDIDPRKWSEVV